MLKIIKSSLYKLSKDWTFRITLIIGAALALLLNLLYFGIDLVIGSSSVHFASGQNALISSLSPVQNFGLTVPINLIIFTIGEFNCGTIRNKIIAGNKKTNIYFGLLITGLIFSLSLMAVYILLAFGIGCIFGGFDPNGVISLGTIPEGFLWKYILQGVMVYIMIVALAIFFATLTRNVGATMPIVIVLIMFLYFWGLIDRVQIIADSTINNATEPIKDDFTVWINPLFTFGANMTALYQIDDSSFVASLVTPFYWAVLFATGGVIIFNKRDVK